MASFEYTVTASPVQAARESTEAVLELDVVSDVNVINHANRSVKFSMDRKSFRGTHISSHREVTLSITYPEIKHYFYVEMIDSLKDYQIAQFDARDLPGIQQIIGFVLLGDQWAYERIGCTHNKVTIHGTLT